jgi:hypothetical protein
MKKALEVVHLASGFEKEEGRTEVEFWCRSEVKLVGKILEERFSLWAVVKLNLCLIRRLGVEDLFERQ